MVADFTKDENGIWWFLNLRAFKVSNPYLRPRLKAFTGWADENSDEDKDRKDKADIKEVTKNLKHCTFCKIGYLKYELRKKLTLKMLIDMERLIAHIGIKLTWLDFSDPKNFEQSLLYQSFPV